MLYRYSCSLCLEEFDIEHRPTEDPAEFLGCECLGKYLSNCGQVKERKHLPKFKEENSW